MVIIAASFILICGQIGWSPFGWRIIAKPLTWSRIDSLHLQDFLLHCEWVPPSGPPLGIMLTKFFFCLFSLSEKRLDCLICDGLTFNTFIEKMNELIIQVCFWISFVNWHSLNNVWPRFFDNIGFALIGIHFLLLHWERDAYHKNQ